MENVHNYAVKSVPLNQLTLTAANPSVVQPPSDTDDLYTDSGSDQSGAVQPGDRHGAPGADNTPHGREILHSRESGKLGLPPLRAENCPAPDRHERQRAQPAQLPRGLFRHHDQSQDFVTNAMHHAQHGIHGGKDNQNDNCLVFIMLWGSKTVGDFVGRTFHQAISRDTIVKMPSSDFLSTHWSIVFAPVGPTIPAARMHWRIFASGTGIRSTCFCVERESPSNMPKSDAGLFRPFD